MCTEIIYFYLFGAVACTEKLLAVFPAALERLDVGTGVVVDQVLLQMLHHPEHQRTAVPLSTQHNTRLITNHQGPTQAV